MMNSDIYYHGDVVVFDLDDTLLLERDYCRSAFMAIEKFLNERFKEKGAQGAFRSVASNMTALLEKREAYFDFLEDKLRKIFENEKEDNEIALIMRHLVDKIYRDHRPSRLPAYLDSHILMSKLNSIGVKMGIITDGRSNTQRNKISSLRINDFINPADIIISEETGFDKSRPENFRLIVNHYPEAKRFFYIADNPSKDFHIANILGWITLQVPHNNNFVQDNIEISDKLLAPSCKLISFNQVLTDFELSSNKSNE